jgi:hypothetical protein
VKISSCTIDVEEERKFFDEDELVKAVYRGKVHSCAGQYDFEILAQDWHETSKFMSYFGVLAGSSFTPLRSNAELVKQAAMGFAAKFGYQKTNYLITQGWYQETYLMPNVKVDKDGVSVNTEKVVEMGNKAHANFLGFKILEEDHFRELMLHVKKDFLNAWPRLWTTVSLSHALLAAVTLPLKLRKKPTLFFEGLTGTGKTELTHTIQYFWGEFDSLVNLTSTAKGLMAVAHDFKDCLLVFDDYKGLDYGQTSALQKVIQYSYDPNTAVKLNKDSTIRKPQGTRGVICFTGEQFVTNDAAMVARTILIEVNRQDTTSTREAYNKCLENRKDYSGITPRFIHWFLQQDRQVFLDDLKELHAILYQRRAWKNNADRIAYNLGLNHVVWKMFVSFMYESGACVQEERNELIREHYEYIGVLQDQMLARCEDEQNGEAFLRVLLQLIAAGEAIITGYNDKDDLKYGSKTTIGYIDYSEGTSSAHIFPDIAFRLVKASTRDNQIRGTEREFGRQFFDMGIIKTCDEGRTKKSVKRGGQINRVWVFNMEKLGLLEDSSRELRVIQGGSGKQIQIDPDTVAISGPDGTF